MSDTLEIKSSVELYDSIETMPYWNWDKVIETGDLRYCISGFEGKFLKSDQKKYKQLIEFLEERRIDREDRERELRTTLVEEDYIIAIRDFRRIMTEEVQDKITELEFTSDDIFKDHTFTGLSETWMSLEQQHMDEFGTEDTLRTRVRSMSKLKDLNIKFILSGGDGKPRDTSILNFINFEEHKLNVSKVEHFKMYDIKDAIERFKKFRIDPKEVTVIEWYYALKNMVKDGNSTGE